MGLQTEYPFTLPKGYVDDEGTLHRTGIMRLACARDEIEPLRDARVKENEAYATVIVLAKVVTELGTSAGSRPRSSRTCSSATSTTCRTSTGSSTSATPAILDSVEAGTPFPRDLVEAGWTTTAWTSCGRR